MAQTEILDYLVIGAGVAGLRAAITLADHGQVLVVTKESLGESNTHYAQGGIAVALSGPEDVALHLEDTEYAGDGLVYRPAAQVLVSEGPLRVEELIGWGARFDRGGDGSALLLAREAAHSLPRILHANGDATGAEISRSLLFYAQQHPRIRFADWTMLSRIVVADGRAVAADLYRHNRHGDTSRDGIGEPEMRRVCARAVLIASGGAGQVYSDTTNPAVATGDGIALAAQAGAELADMEFYQFHPTALALPGVPRFLLSEALRGEGAYLRNHKGERFMERYHPLLELAPRDVVARAIAREGIGFEAGPLPVYLDMRHVQGIDLAMRFPGISRFLSGQGLSLQRDLIPVRPAAHYLMGGIRTDLSGRTTVKGLYAAGEAACTGVHGANRLASNSLLEGLVFGARAAEAILSDNIGADNIGADDIGLAPVEALRAEPGPLREPLDFDSQIEAAVTELRTVMWRHAGLLRDETLLRSGLTAHAEIARRVASIAAVSQRGRALIEAQSLVTVARAILMAALAREESRGAHFRNDYPQRNDSEYRKHSVAYSVADSIPHEGRIRFEEFS